MEMRSGGCWQWEGGRGPGVALAGWAGLQWPPVVRRPRWGPVSMRQSMESKQLLPSLIARSSPRGREVRLLLPRPCHPLSNLDLDLDQDLYLEGLLPHS